MSAYEVAAPEAVRAALKNMQDRHGWDGTLDARARRHFRKGKIGGDKVDRMFRTLRDEGITDAALCSALNRCAKGWCYSLGTFEKYARGTGFTLKIKGVE